MDRRKLRDELDTGRPGTGPYDADAVVAAEQCNAANRTRLRALTLMEFREWALDDERAIKVVGAQAGGTALVRNLATVCTWILSYGVEGIDPSNPKHVDMINGLVAGGVWSPEDRAALIEMATVFISRGDELGLGRVRPGEINEARAL